MAIASARDFTGIRDNFRSIIDRDNPNQIGNFITALFGPAMEASQNTLTLTDAAGNAVTLANTAEYEAFVQQYCQDPGTPRNDFTFMASDPNGLQAAINMSYENLTKLFDDIGDSIRTDRNPQGYTGQRIVVQPNGQWDMEIGVYGTRRYGADLRTTAQVPLADGTQNFIDIESSSRITGAITNATAQLTRERTETEQWIEVVVENNQTDNLFRQGSGNEHFQPLDITDEGPYRERAGHSHIWKDDQAVALLEQFDYPMHLETNPGDDTGYQQNRSPFLEVYCDTEDFLLLRSEQSLRGRWRPEQGGRTNMQGKQNEGRTQGGLINRHKFEHRSPRGSQGTGPDGEARHVDLLTEMAIRGTVGLGQNAPLSSVHRLLYQRAANRGLITNGQEIRLEPKVVGYQDRRRTHLIFYGQRELETKLRTLQQQQRDFDTIVPDTDPDKQKFSGNLQRMITKVQASIEKLENTTTMLRRYGGRLTTTFDGLIVSRDEKAGFEAGAFGDGVWPGDRTGRPAHWVRAGGDFEARDIQGPNGRADRINRLGNPILRAEAELDAATSVPIDLAIEGCQEIIDGTRPPPAGVTRDQARRELPLLQTIRAEVAGATDTAMQIQAQVYEALNLRVDRSPEGSTFEQWANALRQQGPIHWWTAPRAA